MRECITTPKYSVAGYFKGVKEMRQRDLLSPHLFLLAMEFLNPTQMLKEKDSSLQGLQLPSQMWNMQLIIYFADDWMIFMRANLYPVKLVKTEKCLEDFKVIYGL